LLVCLQERDGRKKKSGSCRNISENLQKLYRVLRGRSGKSGKHLEILQEEYQRLPGFFGINEALAKEKECNLALQMIRVQV